MGLPWHRMTGARAIFPPMFAGCPGTHTKGKLMQDSSSPASGFRLEKGVAILAALLLVCAGATLLEAQDSTKASDRDIDLAWQRHWKNYARRCIKLRDAYYTCATYEPQFPSSRGITTVGLRQKTSREVTERKGLNLTVKRNLVKPNEEIDLGAKALPEMAIGQYGFIHSAEVLDILGPDEMVIAGVRLVDPREVQAQREREREKLLKQNVNRADLSVIIDWQFEFRDEYLRKQSDRSFRVPIKLRGYSTLGLAKGDRWNGKDGPPQIAIVGEEVGEAKSKLRRPTSILLAVPADSFMRGIGDEKEFIAMLESRGFTKTTFTQLLIDEKKMNPTDDRLADAFIFNKLDGRSAAAEDEKKQ